MTQKRYNEIPKRQKCINKEEPYIGGAEDIVDDALGKPQSQVNQERIEDIASEVQRAQGAENTLEGKIVDERQRALDVEQGLNNRLGTVEQLAEISVGGGDAQIATSSDFTEPDATKRAKVPTVGAVSDVFGKNVGDNEFVYVLRDANKRILLAFSIDDGNPYFGYGVPKQVKDYVTEEINKIKEGSSGNTLDGLNKIISFLSGLSTDDYLINLLNSKVDKVSGKGLINNVYAECQRATEDVEFLKAIESSDKRLLFSLKDNGDFRIGTFTTKLLDTMLTNIDSIKLNSLQPLVDISFDTCETILSSKDEGAASYENYYINTAQVLKISDSLYYMYYFACGESQQNLSPFIAYSTNGKDFVREVPQGITPPYSGTNRIQIQLADGSNEYGWSIPSESCFFKVNDANYPFRLLAFQQGYSCLWKSANGVTFDFIKRIEAGAMDTFPQCIVRGNIVKIYGRMWNNNTYRYITTTTIDIDGNLICPTRIYMGGSLTDNLYVSGATILDDQREILFPTSIDNSTQVMDLRCYIADGQHIEKMNVDFSPLKESDDGQWYVRGMYTIGTDIYIIYTAFSFMHGVPYPSGGFSDVRVAKVNFKTNGEFYGD